MKQIPQQIFEVRRSLLAISFALAALVGLPPFYFAWRTDWHELSLGETGIWLMVLAILWVAGGLFLERGLFLLRAAVAVDSQGIWRLDQGRAELFSWDRIVGIRGRRRFSGAELEDSGGRRLAVSFALEDIDQLAELIQEQVNLPPAALGLPRRCRLQAILLQFSLIFAYTGLFWLWLPREDNKAVTLAFVVAAFFLILDVLRRDLSLSAGAGEIEIRHLRGRQTIAREQLIGISLAHYFGGPWNGYRPALRLHLADGTTRKLYAADPLPLAVFLEAWRRLPAHRA